MVNQEVPQRSGSPPGFFYGYIVVAVALCIMTISFGTRFSFGIFFSPVLTEFGWTRAMTSGAFSLSMIMEGLLGIVMGGLNDRLGPRIVLTFCAVFLGLGYILMSQVSAIWHLYLFYGLIVGIGMSGFWVPLMSTISRWFVKRRSVMTGAVAAGTGIGTLIGAPVASRLISAYDWRLSFIILGVAILVIIISVAQFMRRDPASTGQVAYGKDKTGGQQLKLETGEFSLREASNTRQFWLVFAIFITYGFCIFATMVHIAPHAIDLGISTDNAANILATTGVMNIAGRFILGSIGDRIGNRHTIIIVFILTLAALIWLIPAKEMWMLYLFAAAFGLAHGGMGPLGAPLVAELFGLRSHGLLFGVMGLGFTIGGAAGPLLAGYIFDLTESYQLAFLSCAAISIIGLILIILLKPIVSSSEQYTAPSPI